VALSGGHTVGRCHIVRSGFDGPWTRTPLQFNNEYFKNLIELEWVERKWEGPRQFQDTKTGALMMLPTDIALIRDPAFLPFVQAYAADEKLFFKDFAAAYGKLLALGCPAKCDPSVPAPPVSERDAHSAEFRDLCMHGSLEPVMKYAATADVHQLENTSGRSALHKAAFWGHIGTVQYLVRDLKLNIDVQDYNGDTALHDAARFGHVDICRFLIQAGANQGLINRDGKTAKEVAVQYEKPQVVALFSQSRL